MASGILPTFSPLNPTRFTTLPPRHRSAAFISASVSGSPPVSTGPSTPTVSKTSDLPLRQVPGDYGLPLIGPIKSRLDFFYFQGRDDYLRTKMQQHQSTVVRLNMPPGPFIAPDPRVIALLDAKSFPVLFDVSKVDKTDLFTGTYMPSTDLTGGHRVLSYLDPSEPKHAQLKSFLFHVLSSRRSAVIPSFRETFGAMFDAIDKEVAEQGKSDFGVRNDDASFTYLARSLFDTDPKSTGLKSDAPGLITKWIFLQLGPLLTLGLPILLEELLLHTFRLPALLIKSDYQRLYDFFYSSAAPLLDDAETMMGLDRSEACHNLLFATCFNSFGGMKIFFPAILKWVAGLGAGLHAKLATEVRGAVASVGEGEVTMGAMEAMPLMKSVVYEAFRIEPPVPLQYGRAKMDLVIESHDAAYEVKKGEMLFGFQPFATRDPRVFDRPEEFVPERFVGEEGEQLLKYVVWSNGPETEKPTTTNKQCAGKEFVVLMARLLVVELFLRYDTFQVEIGSSPLGSSVNLMGMKKASAAGGH